MLNQRVRYGLVRRLVRRHRGGAICEVGAGRHGMSKYFPGVPFVGVDLDFDDYGGPAVALASEMGGVKADARFMPFPDGAFDLVFSLDMIEHVPADCRADVITELARITRSDLVVAFPCGTVAQDADRRQAAALEARDKPVPGWLAEHLDIRYPMPEEMDRHFETLGSAFTVAHHESLLLRWFVAFSEWSGLPGRLFDRYLPYSVCDGIDLVGGRRTRRVYHVRMG
jgi:cyclopropane fatty-acyl-phospholipid synthase-like methyltransferase